MRVFRRPVLCLTQYEQFASVGFQPVLGGPGMRGEAVDGGPEPGAVVGMGQVAEFVDADVVGNVAGCADEPPVEADAGGAAADAPEGFGIGEGGGGGNEGGGAGVLFEARQQVFAGAFVQEAAQVGELGGGFFFGQQDFRRPVSDVAAGMDGQGRSNALVPNPFGQGVGRLREGCGFVQGTFEQGFVAGQPLGEGGIAEEWRDVDADGSGVNGAQDEVFLGAAFEFDVDLQAV